MMLIIIIINLCIYVYIYIYIYVPSGKSSARICTIVLLLIMLYCVHFTLLLFDPVETVHSTRTGRGSGRTCPLLRPPSAGRRQGPGPDPGCTAGGGGRGGKRAES